MSKSRIEEEKQVVTTMIEIYCRAHHSHAPLTYHAKKEALCTECTELITYAMERLDRCPFGEDKGVCSRCRIHCYKPQMRQRIGQVMRYSGKRMILHSPSAAIRHLWLQLFDRR